MEDSQNVSSDNVINIMLATDIHLGYLENDQIRGKDSFTAFEEVLILAHEHDVDMILLAGDLYHDAKPSLNTTLQCITLLRKYCFGNKAVSLEILSNQEENFEQSLTKSANFEDPNLNISYPVFSIHGNHDDPIGQNFVSSLDPLARMGLVNYFGRWTDYSHLRVSPVLMRKGETNLALYGLSFLKDHRLARLFKECKVEIEKVDDGSEWFNLMAIHQNRADRGPHNYIPEEVLPDFLDLIVWGHEHDCRITEEWNAVKKFYVTQPGSTVATSLALGESLPKHCGLLQVNKNKFKLTPIKLETVRPFIFKTIVLSEENLGPPGVNENENIQEFLKGKVNEMIEEAKQSLSGNPQQPELPLIRMQVFYENDNQTFNYIRFGQQFSGRIANPQDLLLMKREKKLKDRKRDPTNIDDAALGDILRNDTIDEISVEKLLEKYYDKQPEDKKLEILCVKALGEAVKDFTIKSHEEIIKKVLMVHEERYIDFLMKSEAETEDEILKQIRLCKVLLESENNVDFQAAFQSDMVPANNTRILPSSGTSDDDMDDNIQVKVPPLVSPASRGRGRGSRGPRGSRGARGASTNVKVKKEPSAGRSKKETPNTSDTNWLSGIVSGRSTRQSNQKREKSPIIVDDSD